MLLVFIEIREGCEGAAFGATVPRPELALNQNPLDFIGRDLILAPVVKLRGPNRSHGCTTP
jgi:hypothetical protein